ncbi:MAG: NAD(P)-dependent alcohol dehydrogenase [Acidimicrobiales bacterium]
MSAAAPSGNEAAVLHGVGDLRVEERPMPVPGPGEVLVEVRSVGICGSDVHYYEHGRIGHFVVEAPLVLGHESSGVVAGLGPGAGKRRLGERVALEPGVPCGGCRECRTGRYNLCRDVSFFATPPVDGALARYVTIHEDFAFPLPPSVSDDAGALLEPLSVALWACEKARVGVGARVGVAGAGPIGAVVTLVSRAAGAAEVVLSDPVAARRQRALALGATAAVAPGPGGLAEAAGGADVFFDCSGHPDAVADGIHALRPGGTAVLVGMCPEPTIAMPLAEIQAHEIWVTGTFRYANTYPRAIALAASGAVDLDALVDAHFSLAQSEQALKAARADPSVLKPVVRVSEDGGLPGQGPPGRA